MQGCHLWYDHQRDEGNKNGKETSFVYPGRQRFEWIVTFVKIESFKKVVRVSGSLAG